MSQHPENPANPDPPTHPPDFEKSLAELEKIVQRMERGEQSLEQMLQDYERGMALSQVCRDSLESARQRVEKLVEQRGGGHALEPMDDGPRNG